MVLAVLFSIYIAQLILGPLKKIEKKINEISKGNFNVDITESSHITEINMLIESVKRITKTMKLAVLASDEEKNKG